MAYSIIESKNAFDIFFGEFCGAFEGRSTQKVLFHRKKSTKGTDKHLNAIKWFQMGNKVIFVSEKLIFNRFKAIFFTRKEFLTRFKRFRVEKLYTDYSIFTNTEHCFHFNEYESGGGIVSNLSNSILAFIHSI